MLGQRRVRVILQNLKTEWLYHVDLTDLDHAERELFEYIEMFYNNQRLHAYLTMCPRPFLNGYRCRKRLNPLSLFPGHIKQWIQPKANATPIAC